MTVRRGGRPAPDRLTVRVRTAKGRKASSTRWLQRQLNDPYVREARAKGYRSRAAFKLLELDDKFHFLTKGARVLDLGAAPGGWTQVAVERVAGGTVVAADLLEMDPVPGAEILQLDVLDPDAQPAIEAALGGDPDVILSDMGAPATGHRQTDHLRSMALCEAAFDLACALLAPGGTLVMKALQGGAERDLLAGLKRRFSSVRHVKPPASRTESRENYIVATGFRDGPGAENGTRG